MASATTDQALLSPSHIFERDWLVENEGAKQYRLDFKRGVVVLAPHGANLRSQARIEGSSVIVVLERTANDDLEFDLRLETGPNGQIVMRGEVWERRRCRCDGLMARETCTTKFTAVPREGLGVKEALSRLVTAF